MIIEAAVDIENLKYKDKTINSVKPLTFNFRIGKEMIKIDMVDFGCDFFRCDFYYPTTRHVSELMMDIESDILFLWDTYAMDTTDLMTDEAKKLRSKLLEYFRMDEK